MSGSKNCPETPRQKMIGMMYLVLTAMLALNVSSEILNGFTLVDRSLRNTIESSNIRTQGQYADFEDLYRQNPVKIKEWLDKAHKIKAESDSLFDYIQQFKYGVLKIADKEEADPNAINIISKDNLDAASEYALVRRNGKKLKKRLQSYRDLLVEYSDGNPTKQEMIKRLFDTKDKKLRSWEQTNFDNMPVSAVITMLTKYQSDVRATETDVVAYLKSQTDAADFRVNKIEAVVIPNSKYVIQGGKYSAKIVLAATDSTKDYSYFINGAKLSRNQYEVSANHAGTYKYKGKIDMPTKDGTIRSYAFADEYVVGKPSATISNVDLNVVYRGINNKFRISVPGVANENVRVRGNGVSVQPSGEYFIVKPQQDGEVKIIVSALIEGKEQVMGSETYRVKYLPDPQAYVQYRDAGGIPRNVKVAKMSKRQLSSGISIIASYGENELIKAQFRIQSFTMVTIFGASTTQGNKLNKRQLSQIDQLEGGDNITFKQIKAVGPDGKIRTIGPIVIEL